MITTGQHILNSLGYFDLFHYPLKREEIYQFHAVEVSRLEIDIALGILVKEKTVFRIDEFFALRNERSLAERRRNGNQLAVQHMQIAARVARLLARFPYVKGVAVSGSLSKDFATEKTDIDFFIVAAANRLWIARTCMHLYKKLTFLTGRQHCFCMNYYVDEQEPGIPEKNIFTAIEIITLRPMQGRSSLDHFVKENNWVKEYFPVYTSSTNGVPDIKPGPLRRLFERLLNGRVGDKLENRLMKLTQKRWQLKTIKQARNSRGMRLGMVVGPHFSKPDPKNFQDKVVEQYRNKVQQLLQLQNKTSSLVM